MICRVIVVFACRVGLGSEADGRIGSLLDSLLDTVPAVWHICLILFHHHSTGSLLRRNHMVTLFIMVVSHYVVYLRFEDYSIEAFRLLPVLYLI